MFRTLFASVAGLAALSACQSMPNDMRVADYCADPANSMKDICQIQFELDGQKKALADTDMSVAQARAIADDALNRANSAQAAAEEARRLASAAYSKQSDELHCETRTIQKTDTGTCSPGYTLVSCNQTRYTYRAGGLSFLREIDDKKCRFNSRVLEMKVRCCMAGANAAEMLAPEVTASEPSESRSYAQPGY